MYGLTRHFQQASLIRFQQKEEQANEGENENINSFFLLVLASGLALQGKIRVKKKV